MQSGRGVARAAVHQSQVRKALDRLKRQPPRFGDSEFPAFQLAEIGLSFAGDETAEEFEQRHLARDVQAGEVAGGGGLQAEGGLPGRRRALQDVQPRREEPAEQPVEFWEARDGAARDAGGPGARGGVHVGDELGDEVGEPHRARLGRRVVCFVCHVPGFYPQGCGALFRAHPLKSN